MTYILTVPFVTHMRRGNHNLKDGALIRHIQPQGTYLSISSAEGLRMDSATGNSTYPGEPITCFLIYTQQPLEAIVACVYSSLMILRCDRTFLDLAFTAFHTRTV